MAYEYSILGNCIGYPGQGSSKTDLRLPVYKKILENKPDIPPLCLHHLESYHEFIFFFTKVDSLIVIFKLTIMVIFIKENFMFYMML